MSEQRVLPADVFDALELSVLAYKGVGQPAVQVYDENCKGIGPCCIYGHAIWAEDTNVIYAGEIATALSRAGISGLESDEAIASINRRRGRDPERRVSWPAYTRELNIVRGN